MANETASPQNFSDEISQALFDALITSEPEMMKALAAVVEEFRTKRRTWNLVRQQPFARKLLDAIGEASEVVNTGPTNPPPPDDVGGVVQRNI